MAIALRGLSQSAKANNGNNAKANNGNNVTLTLDAVTPPQEGDVVVVWGGHGDAVTTLTAPSGNSSGTYTQIAVHTGSTPIFGAWYQVMGATPDATITGFGSGNNQDATAYGCFVLSGSSGRDGHHSRSHNQHQPRPGVDNNQYGEFLGHPDGWFCG
jgi:hypothetical protein